VAAPLDIYRMTAPMDARGVVRALRATHLHDRPREALLREACERIQAWGPPFTSVYAYMLHGESLVLEAHAGRETEHTKIAVGVGVCGTAVAEGEDQNVADVGAVGNYLACNIYTKSELVVLIRRGAAILGQIDIDSDVAAGFGDAEHAAVKEVADALAVLL
jgi:GAF domain-containing protein